MLVIWFIQDTHLKMFFNEKTIDWETFQEPSPNKIPFGEEALKRFFRWRCWYDYGTGLSGDLFSHDFDETHF